MNASASKAEPCVGSPIILPFYQPWAPQIRAEPSPFLAPEAIATSQSASLLPRGIFASHEIPFRGWILAQPSQFENMKTSPPMISSPRISGLKRPLETAGPSLSLAPSRKGIALHRKNPEPPRQAAKVPTPSVRNLSPAQGRKVSSPKLRSLAPTALWHNVPGQPGRCPLFLSPSRCQVFSCSFCGTP